MTITALTTALAAAAQMATAAPAPTEEVTFRFAASDLATTESAARLHTRMKRSAASACRGSRLDTRGYAKRAACRDEVLDQWVAAIDAPVLSAVHEGAARRTYAAR